MMTTAKMPMPSSALPVPLAMPILAPMAKSAR
jgi:hypothetical protein